MQERVQTGHVFPVGTAMPPRFMRPFVSRSLTPTLINELISVIPREKCLIAPLWFEDAQLWGVDGRCYCGCPRRWEALPQCEGRRHEPSYLSAGRTHANRRPEEILPEVTPTSTAGVTECIVQINKEFVL